MCYLIRLLNLHGLVRACEAAFERRRYMNVVVQRARHPELRDYIHSAASGLLPFIQKVSVCQ